MQVFLVCFVVRMNSRTKYISQDTGYHCTITVQHQDPFSPMTLLVHMEVGNCTHFVCHCRLFCGLFLQPYYPIQLIDVHRTGVRQYLKPQEINYLRGDAIKSYICDIVCSVHLQIRNVTIYLIIVDLVDLLPLNNFNSANSVQ